MKYTDKLLEDVTRALAIADQYGLEADNEGQVQQRIKLYETNHPLFPEESRCVPTDEHEVYIRGKDHWRKLARMVLGMIPDELQSVDDTGTGPSVSG